MITTSDSKFALIVTLIACIFFLIVGYGFAKISSPKKYPCSMVMYSDTFETHVRVGECVLD
jgi:hypothetical protein